MNNVPQMTHTFNDNLETKTRRGRPRKQAHAPFTGFEQETLNAEYFRVPSIFLSLCALIDNLAELKIVMYIMRHTWGFREYDAPKRITIDEFMHGRKRADGTRMDLGTGLSKKAILQGLQRAIEHGIILCFIDDHDKARVKQYYQLRMQSAEQTGPESPDETVTAFEEDTHPYSEGVVTSLVTTVDEQYTEESYTDHLENEYPEQEQEYDPYAGTIFSKNFVAAKSPEEKNFASETGITNTTEVNNKYHRGVRNLPRTENRIEEETFGTKEIRNAPISENLEEAIRYLPEADQLPKPKAKSPAFIRNMITDFSRDLGDNDHIPSNIAQAARLYRSSGATEEAFMQALYEARATAKKATQIRHLNSHGNPNRMPYFFRCLARALTPQETAI